MFQQPRLEAIALRLEAFAITIDSDGLQPKETTESEALDLPGALILPSKWSPIWAKNSDGFRYTGP